MMPHILTIIDHKQPFQSFTTVTAHKSHTHTLQHKQTNRNKNKHTHLTGVVLGGVNKLAERGKQLRPVGELPSHGYCADERTSGGPDQRGGVGDGLHALLLDERLHLIGKARVVHLDVVLENESSYGPRRFVLRLELGEDKDEVVVEIWVLV